MRMDESSIANWNCPEVDKYLPTERWGSHFGRARKLETEEGIQLKRTPCRLQVLMVFRCYLTQITLVSLLAKRLELIGKM